MKKILLISFTLLLSILLCSGLIIYGCPNPEVISLSVNKGLNNETINLTVTGSKFHKSVYLKLTKDGTTDILATNVKIVSKTEVSCTLDLKGKSIGQWNVVVANIGSISKKDKPTILAKGFTIEYPAPTLTALAPKEGLNNGTITLKLTGTNFRAGATVKLDKSGLKRIDASNIKVISDTQISCEINLSTQPAGTYDLFVTNDDAKTASLPIAFKVTEPVVQPVVTVTEKVTEPAPATIIETKPEISITSINESLKSTFFDFNKSNIRNDQLSILDADVAILSENSNLYVSLGGHADERGTKEYNIKLSEKRAQTIKNYLIGKGIAAGQIIIFAFGKDYPARTGKTEADWQYNRRVDITVWKEQPTKEQAQDVKPN